MSQEPTYTQQNQAVNHKKPNLKSIIIIIITLCLIGFVIYGLVRSNYENHKKSVTLQGQMDMQQTAIASKVPGRIAKVLVTEGDKVHVGEQLIEMDSPEIAAKINQARAGREMAQSQLDKAINGARPQEIAQAKAAWKANQAAADLAKVTYERVNRLYQEGLMARQKRDEAYTQYIAQQEKADAARQQYDLALSGARPEDKETAAAQVAQVDAKLQEALVAEQEANLKSPIDGIVDNIIVNAGEVVGQGVPIINVVHPKDQWVVLNVTENYLNRFGIGQTFEGVIPALSTPDHPYSQQFTVYASSSLADFATWRPTHPDDGFDVRTFQIKARPAHADERVRAGMSVLVEVD